MKKVLLGMSGGLDSSYAALSLLDAGYSVEGAIVRMHAHTEMEEAKASAASLGIPLRIIDAEKRFEDTVVQDFCNAYRSGVTPNPCVLCNSSVKLACLYEEALKDGFDYIASGHYASVDRLANGRYAVRAGKDSAKDQSYMLYRLPQHILERLILPLGDRIKCEIREEARGRSLLAAEREESQEICFVKGESYTDFIERKTGAMPSGLFLDEEGRCLGNHKGILHYTVGQRKGLGVSASTRLFVRRIDAETNTVILSDSRVRANTFYMADPVFSGLSEEECEGIDLALRVRYQAKPLGARLEKEGKRFLVRVIGSEASPAPGQSAVLYLGEHVVAGGIISFL